MWKKSSVKVTTSVSGCRKSTLKKDALKSELFRTWVRVITELAKIVNSFLEGVFLLRENSKSKRYKNCFNF